MNAVNNENFEWARLIYRNQIDGIEAVKQRQWSTTNYTLLIFAAIIGYLKLLINPQHSNVNDALFFLLLASAFWVSIVGIYHLIDMQLVITKYRKKMFNIAERYDFVHKIDMVTDDKADFLKYIWSITGVFISIILAGLSLSIIFLYNNAGSGFSLFSMSYCLTTVILFDIIFSIALACKKACDANKFDAKLKENSAT